MEPNIACVTGAMDVSLRGEVLVIAKNRRRDFTEIAVAYGLILAVIWGLVACFIFLRYRNLWTVAISHAILGITIAMTIPGPIDHNMRVGLGYLKYHWLSHQTR